ncbi:hypothetical protein ACE1AT_12080 [Pelatocladus sp. BLCC-F211]|uniref:hypothetical protein n=1 Tax=Pelatocladus sp. BLCC-F211 TaxID=3342752 RepID=UPI0035BB79DC
MTLLCNILSDNYHRTRAKSIFELAIAPVLAITDYLPNHASSTDKPDEVALVEITDG